MAFAAFGRERDAAEHLGKRAVLTVMKLSLPEAGRRRAISANKMHGSGAGGIVNNNAKLPYQG